MGVQPKIAKIGIFGIGSFIMSSNFSKTVSDRVTVQSRLNISSKGAFPECSSSSRHAEAQIRPHHCDTARRLTLAAYSAAGRVLGSG